MNDLSKFISFPSRRSVVHSANGIVSCTQPLAAQAGIQVLRNGGNAADAAVAVAAALNVTEPTSTGLGGDVFCLFYSASEKRVRGINASGRSPSALTLSVAQKSLPPGVTRIPGNHAHSVTVPGSAAGWVDVVEKFGSGKMAMKDVLGEAIRLAEDGFPVSELSARFWKACEPVIREGSENFGELLKGGKRSPACGEIMKMPGLVRAFKRLANEGKKGFYEGDVAEAIVNALRKKGGVMSLEDLRMYGEDGCQEVDPISLEWGDTKIWECAPNGQGIVALMALGIIEALEEKDAVQKIGGPQEGWGHNQTEYLHVVIEALRIAFSDGNWWIADPDLTNVPTSGLLSKSYLSTRSALFNPTRTNPDLHHSTPAFASTDTAYFTTTDSHGNACSFINSTFTGFGSGIIPINYGFPLQNRGSGFVLDPPTHPNLLAPHKRPYHTIIPGMLTDLSGMQLRAAFGVMGGNMQPQGHVQVLLNMLRCGMNPQEALDAPRIRLDPSNDHGALPIVSIEEGIEDAVIEGLRGKGHSVKVVKEFEREVFGRGQVILAGWDADEKQRLWSAGSDCRGDGHAVGY